MCALSCVQLFVTPRTVAHQASISEWVVISSSKGSCLSRDRICVSCSSCIGSSVQFNHSCLTLCDPMSCSRPGLPVHHQLPEPIQTHVQAGSLWAEQLGSEVAQSCPTLCNPMDCTVHGILQARILEWIAFLFSRDIPNPGIEPRSPALQVDSLPTEPPGKPKNTGVGSLSLLQQIFPNQELNQSLLHCRQILYQLSYEGSPVGREWQTNKQTDNKYINNTLNSLFTIFLPQ